MTVPKRNSRRAALAFLAKNRLMTVGTTDIKRPWGATVFFAYERTFNLLFFSRPDTKHCRHIKKNPNVSAVINHEWRDRKGNIRGLQIAGRAFRVSQRDHAKQYRLFRSRFAWADEFAADHVLYGIRPREVWYIDEKLFGHFFRVRVL